MKMSYMMPNGESQAEFEVSRSRFLATTRPIASSEEMKAFLREMREAHPKANHNCWALISGAPAQSAGFGFSDDGEPHGCAGKPIFTVLQYSGLGQIGMVITRYFGGIKLGTGGMVKAYTAAAKAGIDAITPIRFSPLLEWDFTIKYEQEPILRHLLEHAAPHSVAFNYGNDVQVCLQVREEEGPELRAKLIEKLGHALFQ